MQAAWRGLELGGVGRSFFMLQTEQGLLVGGQLRGESLEGRWFWGGGGGG